MFDGLYSGAATLDVLSRQQDMIAANLANLNTPGHRHVVPAFKERLAQGQTERRGLVRGPQISATGFDFTNGRMESTGRTLDLALSGEGFFAYQGDQGEVFSRDGVVFRDPQGQLVNRMGMPLLGDGGPIQIDPNVAIQSITVGSDGTVSVDGRTVGKVRVTAFEDPNQLQSEDGIYFSPAGAQTAADVEVVVLQGARELSNSHPVSELVNLIIGSRHYESAQRTMRAIADAMKENVQQA